LTSRNAVSVEKCLCRIEHLAAKPLEKLLPQTNNPWQFQAAAEGERIVRISVVPHCAQLWVMSSRSFDAAPLASLAGWLAANIIL
jgi:hypothetical protein